MRAQFKLFIFIFAAVLAVYFSSCSDNSVTTDIETDDQFLERVVKSGYSQNQEDDDNLISGEINDLDDGGPVEGSPFDAPIDSLLRWGRKILNVNVNVQINSEGDSIKNVFVTRLITGEYHIVYKNNGTPTTVIKPYTESTRRKIIFKRVARTNRPMMNWRLYKIGLLDGNTETPQKGTDLVEMNKLEVYVNNVLTYTFNGPDFTSTLFTTRRFDGEGIPEAEIGDEVKIKVYTFSKEIEPDIVAWHWARNVFGFHRVPFEMTHNDPVQGGFNRIYEKTWTIYTGHVHGAHNGYISASTHKSLYDDSLNQFASDLFGIPYRIKP